MDTPVLEIESHVILRPISRRILPEVMESYYEDPEAAKAALPWLKEGDKARGQVADLMIDLEMHREGDSIHFWAIHSTEDNSFVGLVGLGDELQLAASAYNLGYWVRRDWRKKGIASACVDAIFKWQSERTEQSLIEITVHPHNKAGLAVCKSICKRWRGFAVEGFVPIEIDDRTIPHVLHLVQLNRGD